MDDLLNHLKGYSSNLALHFHRVGGLAKDEKKLTSLSKNLGSYTFHDAPG